MTSIGRSTGKAGKVLAVAAALGILVAAAPLLADTISFVPASPAVEQEVTFTYHPVITPAGPIRWEFGDGTYYLAMPGVLIAYHQYKAPGTFLVRAQAQVAGAPPPVATTTVRAVERRTVTYLAAQPDLGRPVTFTANNFLSPSLRWDFDDAGPLQRRAQRGPRVQDRRDAQGRRQGLGGASVVPSRSPWSSAYCGTRRSCSRPRRPG